MFPRPWLQFSTTADTPVLTHCVAIGVMKRLMWFPALEMEWKTRLVGADLICSVTLRGLGHELMLTNCCLDKQIDTELCASRAERRGTLDGSRSAFSRQTSRLMSPDLAMGKLKKKYESMKLVRWSQMWGTCLGSLKMKRCPGTDQL